MVVCEPTGQYPPSPIYGRETLETPLEGVLIRRLVEASSAPAYALRLSAAPQAETYNSAFEETFLANPAQVKSIHEKCAACDGMDTTDLASPGDGTRWRFLIERIELAGDRWALAKGVPLDDQDPAPPPETSTFLEQAVGYVTRAASLGRLGFFRDDFIHHTFEATDRWHEMTGFTKHTPPLSYEDMINHELPPTEAQLSVARRERAIRTGQSYRHEHVHTRPDGRRLILISDIQVETDEKGCPVALAGITMDVTDIRTLEGQLRHEREVFSRAQHAARVAHLYDNMREGYWEASSTFFEFLGCAAPVHRIPYGSRQDKQIVEGPCPDLLSRRRRMAAGTALPQADIITTRSDTGEPVYLELSSHADLDAMGKTQGYFTIAVDVTKSRLLQQKLERERDQHERAQQLARLGHFIFDTREETLRVSDVLWRLIGADPACAPHKLADVFALITVEEFVPGTSRKLTDYATESEPYQTDIAVRRLDTGERLILQANAYPEGGEDGRPARVFGTIRDVTEERALANALGQERDRFAKAQKLGKIGHAIDDLKNGTFVASDVLWDLVGMKPPTAPISYEQVAAALLPPNAAQQSLQRRREAIDAGVAYSFELPLIRQDTGEFVIFAVENHPQKDEHGEFSSFFSVVADVTEQRTLERELRIERESYARAQHLARVGHFSENLRTHELTASSIVWEMLGYTEDDHPTNYPDYSEGYLTEAQRAESRKRRDELMSDGGELSYELELPIRGTKRIGNFSVVVHPDRGEDGEVDRIFGVIADVTETRRLERSLRHERRRFARAQELARLGHYVDDLRDGSFTASEMLWRLIGLPEDETPPATYAALVERLFPVPDHHTSRIRRAASVAMGTSYKTQFPLRRITDGEEREFWVEIYPETDENGAVIRRFGIVQDITDRIRGEHARKELEHALQEAQKLEALNYFAGGMAHELSNLLQPALNFGALAQTAAARGNTDQASKYTDRVLAAVSRATDVTRRALQYVRETPTETTSVPLMQALREARTILHSSGPSVHWSISPDLSETAVDADSTGLLQVLLNLLRNAQEATDHQSRVEVDVAPFTVDSAEALRRHVAAGEYVRVDVTDNGPGIPPALQSKIFDPLVTTKTGGKGTGLGLPVSRGLTERWGGALFLDRSDTDGTRFSILIPKSG